MRAQDSHQILLLFICLQLENDLGLGGSLLLVAEDVDVPLGVVYFEQLVESY